MNWTFLDITSLGNNNQLNLKNNEFKLFFNWNSFFGIKSYTTRNQSIGKQKQLIEIRTKTT